LTAFWLVPSYLRVTIENMKWVAAPGNKWSLGLLAALLALYMLVTRRLARGRKELAWPVFLGGALLVFALTVLGFFYFNFRVTGDPVRLIPELDLVLVLAAAEVLRRMWGASRLHVRVACVLFVLAASLASVRYVKHAWEIYRPDHNYRQRIEYRVTDWVGRNLPHARVFTTGSVRFWYDAWHDLAEVGGGSEQGLINPLVMAAQWHVTQGDDPALSTLWLQAMGADAVIVHEKTSQEVYHDYPNPGKFAGFLPLLYDSGAGDLIYAMPRRAPGIARVVEARRLASLPPVGPDNRDLLRAYVDAIEHGPDRPARNTWQGTDELTVHARVAPGEAVVAQVTYDPA
jgi:hypothetical protein